MLQTGTISSQTALPVFLAGELQVLATRKGAVVKTSAHLHHGFGSGQLQDLEKYGIYINYSPAA